MTLDSFIARLGQDESLDFEDTMAVINEYFDYTPCAFTNGKGDEPVFNEAGQNEGSCKIFGFAQQMQLNKEQTLACFGRFYQDVLNTPNGSDHGNIRSFMVHGWDGITFEGQPLIRKAN